MDSVTDIKSEPCAPNCKCNDTGVGQGWWYGRFLLGTALWFELPCLPGIQPNRLLLFPDHFAQTAYRPKPDLCRVMIAVLSCIASVCNDTAKNYPPAARNSRRSRKTSSSGLFTMLEAVR